MSEFVFLVMLVPDGQWPYQLAKLVIILHYGYIQAYLLFHPFEHPMVSLTMDQVML